MRSSREISIVRNLLVTVVLLVIYAAIVGCSVQKTEVDVGPIFPIGVPFEVYIPAGQESE